MKFNAKLCCYANSGHTYLQTSTNILYIKHTYVHTYMHVRQQWLSSRLENACLRGKKFKKKLKNNFYFKKFNKLQKL